MGNVQALQAAKALTKQISSNEPYVATNGTDVDISRLPNGSRPSLSSTSVASVTLKPSTHTRSDSSVKDMTNYIENHYPKDPSILDRQTNSFVYYLPHVNGFHAKTQDQTIQDGTTTLEHESETTRAIHTHIDSTQPEKTGKPNSTKPVIVDLTLDDSDDNDDHDDLPTSQQENVCLNSNSSPQTAFSETTSRQEDTSVFDSPHLENSSKETTSNPKDTLPKILAAYSLNDNASFPFLSNVFNQEGKEIPIRESDIVIDPLLFDTTRPNGSFLESSVLNLRPNTSKVNSHPPIMQPSLHKTRPNGLVFDNTVRSCYPHTINQRTSLSKNSFCRFSEENVDTIFSNQAFSGNDVMHDVTNTHAAQSYEHRPFVSATSSCDSDDNVVITKVVTASENTRNRPKQRRKAPIEVRQWCVEEQNKKNIEHTELPSSKKGDGSTLSSKQKLNIAQDGKSQQKKITNDLHREAKIRTLKNLLAKQENAVAKMKSHKDKDTVLVSADRILVVEIPDLKSELCIENAEKHSFRVSSKTISINTKGSDSKLDGMPSIVNASSRKRPRKVDPRKINRQEDRYPSYVEPSADQDLVASKRFKGKQKGSRKSRGRNSPKPNNTVVLKDLWHRELEKVEAALAITDGPIDKNSFMMFLGLRRVK